MVDFLNAVNRRVNLRNKTRRGEEMKRTCDNCNKRNTNQCNAVEFKSACRDWEKRKVMTRKGAND